MFICNDGKDDDEKRRKNELAKVFAVSALSVGLGDLLLSACLLVLGVDAVKRPLIKANAADGNDHNDDDNNLTNRGGKPQTFVSILPDLPDGSV